MNKTNILGIEVEDLSVEDILEKIRKYLMHPGGFFHIVSVNPENVLLARKSPEFRKVVATAQIRLVDGIGIVLASRMLGAPLKHRLTGVDLMSQLVREADEMRLRVVLIGASKDLATKLADCYSQSYKNAKFIGLQGYNDVSRPAVEEEERLNAIVAGFMPQIVFAAFGSPAQEVWLDRHSRLFKNCLCMGVGGAFDFLGGSVPRAPKFVRRLGLEWLFRLVSQPWRWRRQAGLIKFILLVIKQKLTGKSSLRYVEKRPNFAQDEGRL